MNKKSNLLSLVSFIAGFFIFASSSFSQATPQVKSASLPEDIPLYPGAKMFTGSELQQEGMPIKVFQFEADAFPTSVVSWYKENLTRNGWVAIPKKDVGFPLGIPLVLSEEIRESYGKTYLSFWKSKADGCYSLTIFGHTVQEKNLIVLSELHSSDFPCLLGKKGVSPSTTMESIFKEGPKRNKQILTFGLIGLVVILLAGGFYFFFLKLKKTSF